MNALIQTAVIALFVGLLSFGVLGLRLAYSPNDDQEDRRREELQRLKGATLAREQARREAAKEYINQRCTLTETMQRFQELDHQWPDYSEVVQEEVAPKCFWKSEEERQYEQIVGSVSSVMLARRPLEWPPILRRLEKDFQQLQASKWTLSTTATDRSEKSR